MIRNKQSISNRHAFESLSSTGYLVVHKRLLQTYGPEAAIFIANLIDKYLYFEDREMLEDGWFFNTHENQIQETGMTEHAIRKCKTRFRGLEIIKTKWAGVPAKEWYKIDINALIKSLNPSPSKCGGLGVADCQGLALANSEGLPYNKNKYNKNKSSSGVLGKITSSLFGEWWKEYPNKTDKGKAKTSWDRLCQKPVKERPRFDRIMRAVRKQKETERWADPKFIPHPTTWLNQSRWLDDPKEMVSFKREPKENPYQTQGQIIDEGIDRLEEWLEENQKRPAFKIIPAPHSQEYPWYSLWQNIIPSPKRIAEKYEIWLKEQDWIAQIQPGHFDPEGKTFQQYRNAFLQREEVDFITGRRNG